MEITIETEVITGMAGPVIYKTKPCPFGCNGFMKGEVAKVGDTSCMMCKNFGGINEVRTEFGEVVTESVECNHE